LPMNEFSMQLLRNTSPNVSQKKKLLKINSSQCNWLTIKKKEEELMPKQKLKRKETKKSQIRLL